MPSTGHGGSDGLHGYVPSLDHVVADTVSIPFLCVCVCSMASCALVSFALLFYYSLKYVKWFKRYHFFCSKAAFLEKVKLENPGVPCFLFGHSTGGAVVLKVSVFCENHVQFLFPFSFFLFII